MVRHIGRQTSGVEGKGFGRGEVYQDPLQVHLYDGLDSLGEEKIYQDQLQVHLYDGLDSMELGRTQAHLAQVVTDLRHQGSYRAPRDVPPFSDER